MKKLLIIACSLMLSVHSFAQSDEQAESLSFIFTKVKKYTTQVNLFKDPGHYVLFEPKTAQWGETFNFETSDKSVSVPMDAVTVATVQDYGIELTGSLGEATLFMDVNAEPGLREKLEAALTEYIALSKTKNYTVYEKTKW